LKKSQRKIDGGLRKNLKPSIYSVENIYQSGVRLYKEFYHISWSRRESVNMSFQEIETFWGNKKSPLFLKKSQRKIDKVF